MFVLTDQNDLVQCVASEIVNLHQSKIDAGMTVLETESRPGIGDVVFFDNGVVMHSPKPSEFHTWDGSQWVEDTVAVVEKARSVALAEENEKLKGYLVSLFRMIYVMFQVGRDAGGWTVADFNAVDPRVVTEAADFKAILDKIDELNT